MDKPIEALSSETLDIIRAIVLTAGEAERPVVDEAMLARFAAGLASSEERGVIVHALTRSDQMRQLLVTLRRKMAGDSPTREPLIAGALRTYQRLRWRAVDLFDPAVRAAMREVGQRIVSERPQGTWAMARSRLESTTETWNMPILTGGEVAATVTAGIETDGSLVLTASANDGPPSVRLSLRDPVFGGVALGSADGREGVYRFAIPAFAESTGIERVASAMFSLEAETEEATGTCGSLSMSLPSGEGASIRINSPPQIANGRLRLACTLPTNLRKNWADYDLELCVVVGSLTLPLTSLPLGSLGTDDASFEAPVHDVPDGIIGCGSVFRLNVVSRE